MALTISINRTNIRTDFQTNTYVSNSQTVPDVLGLSGGGFVSAYNTSGGNWILLNFYDSNFNAIGSFDIPYSGGTTAPGQPSLTELANGNVLVVWDENADGGYLAGRIFNQNGVAVGNELVLSGLSTAFDDPQVAALADGGFAISYTFGGNVYVGRYSPTGTLLGGFTQVNTLATVGTQNDSAIATLANGGYVVTYTDTNQTDQTLRGVVFNANGTVRTPDFVIDAFGDNTQSEVVGLQNGNFAVVRTDSGLAEGGTLGNGISLSILDTTGLNLTGSIRVNTISTVDESQPDIALLPNGYIVVTWTRPFDGTDRDIYARVFTQEGTPVAINGSSTEFVITASASDDVASAVSGIIGGLFVTSWQDSQSDSSGGRISSTVSELTRTVTGDGANDVFTGDALRDFINGGGGFDTLSGLGGNDVIEGGLDGDTLLGGDGNDLLFANTQASPDGSGVGDTMHGGGDNDTIRGAGGADALHGEFGYNGTGLAVKPAGLSNNTIGTAQSLNAAFGFRLDENIENSDTHPTVSVNAAGDGTVDFYSFTVFETGEIIIDIDNGRNTTPPGDIFDPWVRLFNSAGTEIGFDDDQSPIDSGSVSSFDSLLRFNITTPGLYYVQVSDFPGSDPIPNGSQYNLQITLPHTPGGNDTLIGAAGNDLLEGQLGFDILDGGADSDTARFGGLNGAGHDILNFAGTIFALDRRDGSYDTVTNVEFFNDRAQTMTFAQIDIFDGLNYAASYNDLALAFRTNANAAASHYLNFGFEERREVDFNPAQYLVNYGDLAAAFGGDLAAARNHFLTSGVDERRLPNDPLDYIASFTDLIGAFDGLSLSQTRTAGLSHYQSAGFTEGRRADIDFDVFQYLANHADVQSAFGANDDMAAWHFINSGHGEGRLWENPLDYVASFSDLIGAFGGGSAAQIRSNGLAHFQASGFTEGRRDNIDFDADQYLANYGDLRAAFANGSGGYNEEAATLHFIQFGFNEGRTDDVFLV